MCFLLRKFKKWKSNSHTENAYRNIKHRFELLELVVICIYLMEDIAYPIRWIWS